MGVFKPKRALQTRVIDVEDLQLCQEDVDKLNLLLKTHPKEAAKQLHIIAYGIETIERLKETGLLTDKGD
jgi:hypothetical protein